MRENQTGDTLTGNCFPHEYRNDRSWLEENLMKLLTRSIALLAILTLLYSIFPLEAYAYLDPGTGSYILQIAIAAILGAAFAIKLFWGRLKSFLQNLRSKREGNEQNGD